MARGFVAQETEEGPLLPTVTKDEYRPMERKLPEFKFWQTATLSVLVVLASTASLATDIPVFWPVLILYFLVAVFVQCRMRVAHMLQHGYVPWDFGGKKSFLDHQQQQFHRAVGPLFDGASISHHPVAAAAAAALSGASPSAAASGGSVAVAQHPPSLPPTLKARQL